MTVLAYHFTILSNTAPAIRNSPSARLVRTKCIDVRTGDMGPILGMTPAEGDAVMAELKARRKMPVRFTILGLPITRAVVDEVAAMATSCGCAAYFMRSDGSLIVTGSTTSVTAVLFTIGPKWPNAFTHEAGVVVYMNSRTAGRMLREEQCRLRGYRTKYGALACCDH